MHGQDAYREAERRTLTRLIGEHERFVLATTGAIVLEAASYQLLRSRCVTIWLRAAAEDHLSRVIAQATCVRSRGASRPSVRRARSCRSARLYQLADLVIDTSAQDETSCLERLVAWSSDGWSGGGARSSSRGPKRAGPCAIVDRFLNRSRRTVRRALAGAFGGHCLR